MHKQTHSINPNNKSIISSLQISLFPNTKQRTNPHLIQKQFDNYKKNVTQFKKAVQQEIHKMVQQHKSQIKKLTDLIDTQKKIINQYQRKYGKIIFNTSNNSILVQSNNITKIYPDISDPMFQNSIRKIQSLIRSPNKNYESPTKSFMIQNINQKNQDRLASWRQLRQTEQILFSSSADLQVPPDQMYKSKFQQTLKMKKSTHRQLYESLKQNKKVIDINTTKVLEYVNQGQELKKKQQANIKQITLIEPLSPSKRKKKYQQQKKQQLDPLNTSLSYLCDSVDRLSKSKSSKKNIKRVSQRIVRPKQNPEAQKKAQKKKKLQGMLRNMRENINMKVEVPPIISPIKQSKLLPTGPGMVSKVLINPVPIDLTKKNQAGGNTERTPSPNKNYSSILKKSSAGDFNKLNNTIQGLSVISYKTAKDSALSSSSPTYIREGKYF